ncbi:PadR family transcriptional regulator [Ktedonosporobacter rubrisoli]|uniref:PadR family transcriptional regulator n=1 Tax=Ktedonosporobacter rubrisoli TaxID=2509675 RepID=A0A4P6JK65_KTERU|nr:PadR family transcriptional regulator [Ktedonosporobacter rubrisoli]QBD75443.1 PadR family transcriptional regulator [Ktedonosporobacter rubrisoli]
MYKLNATAASLLGFLHEGPMSGWDLVTKAQTVIGDFWSLTPSQIYRELSSLATAGLVQAGEREQRDRRPFSITAEGRAAFAAWIIQEPSEETIRFPLLLSVSFGKYLPKEKLISFVRSQRSGHQQRLDGYRQQHSKLIAQHPTDPYALAILDFGLRYEEAVLSWIDSLTESFSTAEIRAAENEP